LHHATIKVEMMSTPVAQSGIKECNFQLSPRM
jgi:hypothetical protein